LGIKVGKKVQSLKALPSEALAKEGLMSEGLKSQRRKVKVCFQFSVICYRFWFRYPCRPAPSLKLPVGNFLTLGPACSIVQLFQIPTINTYPDLN